MDSACALVTFGQGIAPVSRVLGVPRAQLTLRMKASDNKPDKRRQRRDEAADAEVLSRILDIIGDMPAYGYRRVWAILRRQSRNEGLPFVNAKRVYRIMSENSLLLLHDKLSRQHQEYQGCISPRYPPSRNHDSLFSSHQKYTTTGVRLPCQRFTGSSAPGKFTRTSLRDVPQTPAICWLPFACDNSDSAPEINAS